MHLPSSWGNPDEAMVDVDDDDGGGGNVVGGVGRDRTDGEVMGVREGILEKSTLEGCLMGFLLGITLPYS